MEIVNVGTGEDVTIRELAEMIAELTGFRGKIVQDTSKPDGTPRKLLDVARLQALGWKAQIPLRQGLEQAFAGSSANARPRAERTTFPSEECVESISGRFGLDRGDVRPLGRRISGTSPRWRVRRALANLGRRRSRLNCLRWRRAQFGAHGICTCSLARLAGAAVVSASEARRADFSVVRIIPKETSAWIELAAAAIVTSAVMLFAIVTQLPPRLFNFQDDLQKYLAHPVRMLATGTMAGSPLSALGSETLGGQAFLHGFILSALPLPYVTASTPFLGFSH